MVKNKMILLDRDGVLNRVLVDPEQGTIDSPLHPSQVQIFPWVPLALARLNQLGFKLAICTNQPAAAKKKTTIANLEATHSEVLHLIQAQGAVIESSHLCLHRTEDGCECRKPKPGLLLEALHKNHGDPALSWMVGDGITDVEAGQKIQLKTAFFGPKKCDACKIMGEAQLAPTFWGKDLREFVDFLTSNREY